MQQQEDAEHEDMNEAPKHFKLDEMSSTEDVDVWDSDDETGAAQRMRAQQFISSHSILSKFSLLVNFLSVRNLVTQSSLATNECLLQLASSSFSNTSQKKNGQDFASSLQSEMQDIQRLCVQRPMCYLIL